jgi:Dolichyl-phosphate-mannose-protein mannosyltransferase
MAHPEHERLSAWQAKERSPLKDLGLRADTGSSFFTDRPGFQRALMWTTTPAPTRGQEAARTAALVLLCTLLGLSVRWPGINREFWTDEYCTAWVVRDGFGSLFHRAWANNLSPAYFLIVRCSADLFGYTEAGLRLPSLLAGVLLIPVVYALCRRLGVSRPLSLLACALMAVDPTGVDFSLEVRPYSLIQLLGAVHVYCYLGLIALNPEASAGARTWRVACFAGLTTALAYLHYLALLIVLPEIAYGAILCFTTGKERSARQLRDVGVGVAVSALFCIPLIPHLSYLFGVRSLLGSFVPVEPLYVSLSYFHAFQYLLFPLPWVLLLEYTGRRRGLALVGPARRPLRSPDGGLPLVFLFFWLYLPIMFVWSSTRIGLASIDLPRYVACSAAAPIIACVCIGMRLSSRLARLSLFAIALLAVHLFHPWNHFDPGGRLRAICAVRPDYEQHCETVDFINRECRNGLPVLVVSSLVESDWLGTRTDPLLADYLLCEVNSLHPIECANPGRLVAPLAWWRSKRLSQRDSIALYRESIVRSGGFYLFAPGHADRAVSDRDIRGILEASFAESGNEILDVASRQLRPKLALFTISLRDSASVNSRDAQAERHETAGPRLKPRS